MTGPASSVKRGQRRVSSTETTIPETTPITTSGERPLERLGEAEPDRVVAASPAKGGGDQDWEADAERGAHEASHALQSLARQLPQNKRLGR